MALTHFPKVKIIEMLINISKKSWLEKWKITLNTKYLEKMFFKNVNDH